MRMARRSIREQSRIRGEDGFRKRLSVGRLDRYLAPWRPGDSIWKAATQCRNNATNTNPIKRHMRQSQRQYKLMALLCLGLIASSGIGFASTTPDRLIEVSLDKASGAGISVAGVHIRCERKNGAIEVALTGKNLDKTFELERDVVIYVSSPTAEFILLHYIFASNEDRILSINTSAAEQPSFEIAHDDNGDYIHVFRCAEDRCGKSKHSGIRVYGF